MPTSLMVCRDSVSETHGREHKGGCFKKQSFRTLLSFVPCRLRAFARFLLSPCSEPVNFRVSECGKCTRRAFEEEPQVLSTLPSMNVDQESMHIEALGTN